MEGWGVLEVSGASEEVEAAGASEVAEAAGASEELEAAGGFGFVAAPNDAKAAAFRCASSFCFAASSACSVVFPELLEDRWLLVEPQAERKTAITGISRIEINFFFIVFSS